MHCNVNIISRTSQTHAISISKNVLGNWLAMEEVSSKKLWFEVPGSVAISKGGIAQPWAIRIAFKEEEDIFYNNCVFVICFMRFPKSCNLYPQETKSISAAHLVAHNNLVQSSLLLFHQ